MRYSPIILLSSALVACASFANTDAKDVHPDVIEHPVPDDLAHLKQPESLVADLEKIQSGTTEERKRALVDKIGRDFVFVQGGDFLMGDFGLLRSQEKLPWDNNAHSSPLHEVTLASYSISRYKVTLAEFDLYAEANGVSTVQTESIYVAPLGNDAIWRTPDKPAGVTWEQASSYCGWLGGITGSPIGLPTEAQWEYAARNRGEFIVYPTDSGKLEWNKNVPSSALIGKINSGARGWPYSIALFPPNPLGIYDLTKNSLDWVQDWYSADYYSANENSQDPSGPSEGQERVQRSWPASNSRAAMTMSRRSAPPIPAPNKAQYTTSNGFRCALKSEGKVQ